MATTLNIAFVGSGAIHFGGAEMPWDHASRLEIIGGVNIVGIVDPLVEKAKAVLERRRSGKNSHMYQECNIYPDVATYLSTLKTRPDAVFVGVPPAYHGCCESGKDIELQLIQAGYPVFIEKPVSVVPPEEFASYATKIQEAAAKNKVPVSVGYMFRYHAGVLKMKELIQKHGGKVMAFVGHYYLAYSELDHAFWWDIRSSGGPIVEQATHFCDLARFLVGEVDLDSIQAMTLKEADEGQAGVLQKIKTESGCEVGISSADKIPRVTMATWRFQDGGLGSLTHAVALQGKKYESSLDILMDGLRMTLHEPYHPKCKLLVRDGSTGSDDVEVYDFGKEDLYLPELRVFLEAVRNGDCSSIASPYSDATRTYDLTWAIRRAGEKHPAYSRH